jgi:uncharacterized membrane protein
MIITIISFVIIPERFVIFGVLHCIGTSIILSIPFIKYRELNIMIGSVCILLGFYLSFLTVHFTWLLPFGLIPAKYYSIDFFPLLPWFGVVLMGISIGHYLYPEAQRGIQFSINAEKKVLKSICFLGRHSLHVYFLHQPVLFLLIFLLAFFFL